MRGLKPKTTGPRLEAAQILLNTGHAAACVVDESGAPVGVITEDGLPAPVDASKSASSVPLMSRRAKGQWLSVQSKAEGPPRMV